MTTPARKTSIMLATPAYGGVDPEYMMSVLRASRELSDRYDIDVQLLKGESLITRARCTMFSWFLETEHDHLLFVDADIAFTPEHVVRLIESLYPVAALPYPKKETYWGNLVGAELKTPWDAYRLSHGAGVVLPDGYQNSIGPDGFTRATYLSTGFMRISRWAAERINAFYPDLRYLAADGAMHSGVFNTLITPEGQLLGEDYSFCQRWTDMGPGYDVWCAITGDPLWHIGTYANVFNQPGVAGSPTE